MPKLLIFAPCEKAIISQENTVSMITILEELKVQVPRDQPIPSNSAFPMQWAILTLWQQQEGDEDKEFEERCDLLSEEGKNLITAKLTFRLPKRLGRVLMNMVGFPIEPGQCRIKMYLREIEPSSEWKEIAEYPLKLQVEPS
jgi:hypothetical protein